MPSPKSQPVRRAAQRIRRQGDDFHLGFRCRCIAIDTVYGSATFRHEGDGGTTFTIPLFGTVMNKIDSIGIQPGDQFWFRVQRTTSAKKKKKRARKKVAKKGTHGLRRR